MEPVLNHLSQEKGLAGEALANMESILIYDDDQEAVADPLAIRITAKWMEFAQSTRPEETSFKEKMLRDSLLLFGKKKPKVRR